VWVSVVVVVLWWCERGWGDWAGGWVASGGEVIWDVTGSFQVRVNSA
jgi:hypothetical protein